MRPRGRPTPGSPPRSTALRGQTGYALSGQPKAIGPLSDYNTNVNIWISPFDTNVSSNFHNNFHKYRTAFVQNYIYNFAEEFFFK